MSLSGRARRLNMRIYGRVMAIVCFALAVCAVALVWPAATGDKVKTDGGTVVDMSNASDGYICVKHTGSGKKLKLRVSLGDTIYTYDLNNNGDFEVFPLQLGSGKYKVSVYQLVKGSQYTQESSISVKASLNDENAAFLCPSQFSMYTQDSPAVIKSNEICSGLSSDSEKVAAVYDFVRSHMTYNHVLALTVKSGYVPNVDEVYEKQMGICFDLASIMACMLRVQGIPTKIVIGYADNFSHAWNEILVSGEWVRYDVTAAINNQTMSSYTTERFY